MSAAESEQKVATRSRIVNIGLDDPGLGRFPRLDDKHRARVEALVDRAMVDLMLEDDYELVDELVASLIVRLRGRLDDLKGAVSLGLLS